MNKITMIIVATLIIIFIVVAAINPMGEPKVRSGFTAPAAVGTFVGHD